MDTLFLTKETRIYNGAKTVSSIWENSLSCGPLFGTPWTVAHQAPLSMGFSRQGYWSGLPFPSPGHLPNPGIKTASPALAGGLFVTRATWEAP